MELERKIFFERLQRVHAELQEIMQSLPELRQAQNYNRYNKRIRPDITIIQAYDSVYCYFHDLRPGDTPTWKELKVLYVSSKDPDNPDDSEQYDDCGEY